MKTKIKLLFLIIVILLALPSAFADVKVITLRNESLLSDASLRQSAPNTNYDYEDNLQSNQHPSGYIIRSEIQFNASNITRDCSEILEAYFFLQDYAGNAVYEDQIYEIFGNATGDPSKDTYNSNPSGNGNNISNGHLVNLTSISIVSVTQNTIPKFNITNIWKNVLSGNYNNATFGIAPLNPTAADTQHVYYSSSAATGQKPLVNVTCETTTADTTKPIINATLNISTIRINNVVNITANATDETGLSGCQFIENMTLNGKKTYTNISISGTSAQCSNKYTISLGRGNVINFTVIANDTTNNLKMNDTIITVANTVPTHTTPLLNSSDGLNKTNANLTGFNQSGSDADSDQIIFNYKWYKNNITNASRFIDNGSLVLYLPFDENSTKDFSGKGNDGTAFNGANVTPEGKVGDAYMFDGVDDYVNVSDADSLDIIGSFSISLWVNNYNFDASVDPIILSKGDGVTTNYMVQTASSNGGYSIWWNNAGWQGGTDTGATNQNQWYYLAFTWDGSNVKAYLDGILKTTTPETTPPLANTLSLRIGYVGEKIFNGTIDEVRIYNRSLSASEISQSYWGTVNRFANLNSSQTKKNENWTIEMTPYDVAGKGIPLNSTMITVGNTIPNATYILNASGDTDSTNRSLNLTYCYDPDKEDGIDTINYVVYMDKNNPPTALLTNTTSTNFTTNATSDGIWYAQAKCMDSESESALSSVWNWTLDTVIPTLAENSTSYNNSHIRGNITFGAIATDVNMFNMTGNLSQGAKTYYFVYNDTKSPENTLAINYSINLSGLPDGKYNWTWEAVDSHSKIPENIVKGKKGEDKLIFSDDTINKNISIGVFFREKLNKLTDTPATLKYESSTNEEGFITWQVNFTVLKPETKIAFNVSTTVGDIKILDTDYEAHLLMIPYGMDFNATFLVNGTNRTFTTTITRISRNEVEVLVIPDILLAGNDVVVFTSETLFGLNQIVRYSQIIVDNSLPTINYFNISGFANNTFTSNTLFNLTVNASDGNPNSTQIYLNNIANSSSIYLNNTETNTSFTIATDGNYTINITINDTAGNKISSSYFYNLVVDTTLPVFTEAVNRTIANSTNILDNTDVNLSIFGAGDIYLKNGNFSYNISNGTWYNVSSFNNGNGTYHTIISQNNLTDGMVGGWKFYAYDLAGNELDPIYTYTVGSSAEGEASPASPSGEGAGPAYSNIQTEGKQANQTIEKKLSQQAMLQLCNADVPFINRLFSKCKIADNNVCDDGESLFIDTDCTIKTDDIATRRILEYMWLLRFLILLSIFLLAVNNNKFPIAAIALVTLLVYNGAFAMAEASSQTQLNTTSLNITAEQPITENGQNPSCMDVNFFINFGPCVNSNNPIIGWAIGIAIIVAIAILIFREKKKRHR